MQLAYIASYGVVEGVTYDFPFVSVKVELDWGGGGRVYVCERGG
jgi:hypothetical protein